MPVSGRKATVTGSTDPTPEGLRPYIHHGIDLDIQNNHGVGDCPFCGEEGKFSVDCDSGLWRCFVCGSGTEKGGGNPLVFIRLLHETALEKTDTVFLKEVAKDRRLCDHNTVAEWGVCKSTIGGYWLVPGYAPDGSLHQLYKRTRVQDSDGEWTWRLLPTPGVWPEGQSHGLHMSISDYMVERSSVVICEGPWDAMALWEVLSTELGSCNVVAVPGCNVWNDDRWNALCLGKAVTVMFDSDHPRKQGIRTFRPGFDGVVRIAKRLSGTAVAVTYLKWGPEGYDPDKPNGWDVRDHLSGMPGSSLPLSARRDMLHGLVGKIEHASPEWFSGLAPHVGNGSGHVVIEARACDNIEDCEVAWRKAMRWRQDFSDVLKVTMAVCASTQQSGNQLFLDIVGSPSGGKTTILRGALTSKQCIHVENITKIISGYKMDNDDNRDCSFIARANNKTWITCEFDTILNSPQYNELMGKMRRIFDGETSTTYGNRDTDRVYNCLRTPWIRAGTFKMMNTDQSQLGDRFLRIIVNDPPEEDKYDILMHAMMSERNAMLEQTNGMPSSIVDVDTRNAHALTGGYVDWLRANINAKLPIVEANVVRDDMMNYARLADLSAAFRARPNEDKRRKEDTDGHKEFPARLARQYMRLASNVAVALNKDGLDNEVLRIVRKVALNTSSGHTLNIAGWLCSHNGNGKTHQEFGGIHTGTFVSWCNMPEERMVNYLGFLRKIGVLAYRRTSAGEMWLLTDRMHELYTQVQGANNG